MYSFLQFLQTEYHTVGTFVEGAFSVELSEFEQTLGWSFSLALFFVC